MKTSGNEVLDDGAAADEPMMGPSAFSFSWSQGAALLVADLNTEAVSSQWLPCLLPGQEATAQREHGGNGRSTGLESGGSTGSTDSLGTSHSILAFLWALASSLLRR